MDKLTMIEVAELNPQMAETYYKVLYAFEVYDAPEEEMYILSYEDWLDEVAGNTLSEIKQQINHVMDTNLTDIHCETLVYMDVE